jgi:hypothetical protein
LNGGLEQGIPKLLTDLGSTAPHAIVEFAALTGDPPESLAALDANWLSNVRAALVAGNIREFDLVANDRRFRIGAHPQRKFWRRRQPWLARLAS